MPTIFRSIKKRMRRKMTLMLLTMSGIMRKIISTGRRKQLTLSISAMGITSRGLNIMKMCNLQVQH